MMIKRENEEAKARTQPRKRVAFTAPKDAATKAIIKHNATASSLLGLPFEIRDQIYREVLGDRFIHLKYLAKPDMRSLTREIVEKVPWKSDTEWIALVYPSDGPRDENEKKLLRHHTSSNWQWYGYLFNRSPYTHWNYDAKGDCPARRVYWGAEFGHRAIEATLQYEDLHMEMLRCSRQVYNEASQVLWSTNTFSFNDALTCKHFMEVQKLYQKRMMKTLRLAMDWTFSGATAWNGTLSTPTVKSLSGLREVRLLIHHNMIEKVYQDCKDTLGLDALLQTTETESVLRLSTLSLRKVEVIVTSKVFQSGDQIVEPDPFWKITQRREYSSLLKERLLEPNASAMYAEDQQRKKDFYLQRKLEVEKFGSNVPADTSISPQSARVIGELKALNRTIRRRPWGWS